MNASDVVKDWNGFEKFVAHLHEGADVSVEHNKTLRGESGATRQIDVVIKHTQGPYEYLTLVECKCWNKKVKREQIDVLWASIQDLNASKGVLFTTKGFQAGAETYAESKGIKIFVVRELTEEEWGLPGRVIDFTFQLFQKSVSNLRPIVVGIGNKNNEPTQNNATMQMIKVNLGSKEPSECLVVSSHNKKYPSIESIIDHYSTEALLSLKSKSFTINGGEDCTRYFTKPVNLEFAEPLVLMQDDTFFLIPSISMEVGIKISQMNIRVDRGEKLSYALAVVDCVNKQVFAVAKKLTERNSNWTALLGEKESTDDVLINGSVASGILEGYFDPKEMSDLIPVKFDEKEIKFVPPPIEG